MALTTKWRLLAVLVLALSFEIERVSSSQDVLKSMTTGFAKALESCKKELNIPDHIMQDFYNFWREEYDLVNRELGCAIMCLTSKFDMVTEDNKLHHSNAVDFAKSHGADDALAQQLVTIIHDCEKEKSVITNDDCVKVLEIAKCFRSKIHELKWAPSMEVVLEEVMAEVKSQ